MNSDPTPTESICNKKARVVRKTFIWIFGTWLLLAFSVMYGSAADDAVKTSVLANEDPGQIVFDDICAMCHNMSPPAEDAPSMLMIVRHYEDKHETMDRVREALINWVKEPAEETSSIPEHAMEEFGLMPDVELPDSDYVAVVDYILKVYNEQRDSLPDADSLHSDHDEMMRH